MSKRIPAISLFRVFPEAGGLMSHGPDIADLYRRCGVYAGRVLRGAKTSELPIERPARFFLTFNRKAAKVPRAQHSPALLLQADQVIECAGVFAASGQGYRRRALPGYPEELIGVP